MHPHTARATARNAFIFLDCSEALSYSNGKVTKMTTLSGWHRRPPSAGYEDLSATSLPETEEVLQQHVLSHSEQMKWDGGKSDVGGCRSEGLWLASFPSEVC